MEIKATKYQDYKNPVPIGRVIQKLDSYLDKNDLSGAERHLLYWLNEAELGNDKNSEFTIFNELMGIYRKIGDKENAVKYAEKAVSYISTIGSATISAGTAYLNAATVYKAFGNAPKSMELFNKARSNYEQNLKENDQRLGGLYNNMALTLSALGEYQKADEYFEKALKVMENAENGEPEQAITYLNMADNKRAELGLADAKSIITEHLEKARELLNLPSVPQNGHYAFVCEKCAPTFREYGFFTFANLLEERAREIYEGN